MKYLMYEIKNNINGKIYVGVHKTKVEDDGYMGSGKVIKRAIEKHGIENFTKTILERFDSLEAMFAREKEVVNEEFLGREDVYNIMRGGYGGFDYINKIGVQGFSNVEVAKQGRKLADIALEQKYGPTWRIILARTPSPESIQRGIESRKRNGFIPSTEQMCTEAVNIKRKQSLALIDHQKGNKNSNFGKMWITNGAENKTIPKEFDIPDGWRKGRILK